VQRYEQFSEPPNISARKTNRLYMLRSIIAKNQCNSRPGDLGSGRGGAWHVALLYGLRDGLRGCGRMKGLLFNLNNINLKIKQK
jgi:hypothetical protein